MCEVRRWKRVSFNARQILTRAVKCQRTRTYPREHCVCWKLRCNSKQLSTDIKVWGCSSKEWTQTCALTCLSASVCLCVCSVPPHITQLRNVTAVEGSAAMISCTAEGEPVPEISWRRASDGQTFKDGDKVKNIISQKQTEQKECEGEGSCFVWTVSLKLFSDDLSECDSDYLIIISTRSVSNDWIITTFCFLTILQWSSNCFTSFHLILFNTTADLPV